MKHIRITKIKNGLHCLLVTILFFGLQVSAQTTPEPPEAPPTPKTTKGTSYSISIDNDDDKSSNSSVSISKTNDSYKFRASFHNSKNEGVKAILLNNLGKKNLTINGNTFLWTNSQDGDEVFECKLTKSRLRIFLDTEVALNGFTEKINALGQELKYFISGKSKKEDDAKKAERAQKELEKAEKELERAKRELERAKRDANRENRN